MEAHEFKGSEPSEPDPHLVLAEARQAIEVNTFRLAELLSERFEITRDQVGPAKKALGLPAVDKQREHELEERAEAIGEQFNLPSGLMTKVLRPVIDDVVEEHEQLLGGSQI